jgi:exodeoxyribonuclease V gamma subunit
MLRLVYSNRAEELVAEIARRVRTQQTGSDVLAPVTIVVPNGAVQEYLSFGIARACGVAANLRWMRMTGFAAETVMQATQARVAGADAIEAMALTLLLDEAFLGQPELAPVCAYVATGEFGEAADVRRVQLASRIGRVFEEYTYARSEMLTGWTRGPSLVGRHRETELWQRRMWLGMFGAGGLAGSRGLVPLHEAIAALPIHPSDAERPLHVFGFAHFARAFHRLLARVAKARDVVVYTLSPCDGFWEDVDPQEPPLLRLWARPGREHVRALNASADFDHEDRFVQPHGTLLAQLQRDVLSREPARDHVDASVASYADDQSILVLEHASVRRELEAVASEIWSLLERDETLRFDDIAVLLPDADARVYSAHLTAVFREAHDIPHRLVDIPSGGDSIGEAVQLLLSLPLGRFTRQELLRFAVHPSVVACLDGVDPARWLQWCDDLGIVHGADRADHEDTYIGRDVFNWDQGLRRLALGAFMAGDGSGDRRPFELHGDKYVPCEVAPSDSRDAAAFGLLVRSLVADARFVKAAVLPLKEWATLLCTLLQTYIAPTNEAEVELLADCLRGIHSLGEIDIINRRVAYPTACELARSRVALRGRARGTEGVVVSRIASLQPIPFRVAFACGLGEGRFPSTDGQDPLDLRWARRLEGDVTARERDKYAFLELLLGTRNRLYLSYVSRDALTGDTLPPSSVIEDVLYTLQRGYVFDVETLRRRHPAQRWDSLYFPGLVMPCASQKAPPLGTMRLPEARAEARTFALRHGAEAEGGRVRREQLEARAAKDPAWARLGDHLRVWPLPQAAPRSAGRLVIPMYALVKFLDFPLQGWARFQVGLDEHDDENPLAREDEPFETALRDETLLLREVLFAAGGQGSLALRYDETVHERELRGCGPSGVFARGERAQHLDTLAGWKQRLETLDIPLHSVEVHRFGRTGENASPSLAHPALTLDVDFVDPAGVMRVMQVEVVGRTLPIEYGTSITLSRRLKESREDWARADRQRATLRAFVDYALLCASGAAEGGPHASVSVVSTPEGTVAERVVFETLSRGEATVWLRGLARELLSGPHAYFLPSEAVFLWHRKARKGPVRPWLETAREMLGDADGPLALRSAYGPVPRVHEYPIPNESTSREIILRRFDALLGRNHEGDA